MILDAILYGAIGLGGYILGYSWGCWVTIRSIPKAERSMLEAFK